MLSAMNGRVVVLLGLVACGDNFSGKGTPEQTAAGAKDGQHVEITGVVHTVTYDSTQTAARKAALAKVRDQVEWVLAQDDEVKRGVKFAYDDAGAQYPRLPDHYILIRSKTPDGVTQGEPGFTPGKLTAAWGLGIHITDIDPAVPMPEVGDTVKVTGTFRRITWNQREIQLPVVDNPTIEITNGAPALAGPGASCNLDQECNARLICDRASHTCGAPPREIYWADPWRDVNGACDTDSDCPLGQVCEPSYVIPPSGSYAAFYFPTQDIGRHLCRLAPGSTLASQCPRIYTTRDLAGGRFASGKEVCVRVSLLTATPAEDGDTHAQMKVDEPIPYPTSDVAYHLFGATTEIGPVYKNPALPGGAVNDPLPDQQLVAIGTYRYDPDHGWYEVHPVKAYLPAP
jgi:hypothetical protein